METDLKIVEPCLTEPGSGLTELSNTTSMYCQVSTSIQGCKRQEKCECVCAYDTGEVVKDVGACMRVRAW